MFHLRLMILYIVIDDLTIFIIHADEQIAFQTHEKVK